MNWSTWEVFCHEPWVDISPIRHVEIIPRSIRWSNLVSVQILTGPLILFRVWADRTVPNLQSLPSQLPEIGASGEKKTVCLASLLKFFKWLSFLNKFETSAEKKSCGIPSVLPKIYTSDCLLDILLGLFSSRGHLRRKVRNRLDQQLDDIECRSEIGFLGLLRWFILVNIANNLSRDQCEYWPPSVRPFFFTCLTNSWTKAVLPYQQQKRMKRWNWDSKNFPTTGK